METGFISVAYHAPPTAGSLALDPAAGAPFDRLVGAGLEEARQPVVVAAAGDEPHLRLEGLRVDQLLERHVAQVELALDADHVAVEALLDERAIRADAELAAEHDVERVGRRAPRLVAELEAGRLLLALGAVLVALHHAHRDQLAEVDPPERDVAVLVAREVLGLR